MLDEAKTGQLVCTRMRMVHSFFFFFFFFQTVRRLETSPWNRKFNGNVLSFRRNICISSCSVLSVAAAGGSGARGRFSVCSARQTTIAQIVLGNLRGHRPPINTTCRTQGPSEPSLRARAALSNTVAEPRTTAESFSIGGEKNRR